MNQTVLRALLATLPLLGLSLEAKASFLFGGLGAGILVLAVLVFLLFHVALPLTLHRLSFLLLLLFIGLLGNKLFSLPFIFVASLCVLAPPDLFRAKKLWSRIATKTLLTGALFWGLLATLGCFSDWGSQALGFQFLKNPAGSYFLLGAALVFVPKFKRRSKKGGKNR
jgi:hypothetical protein